ncbi:MAG: DUF1801 domain-containing protein [Gammaproteobacteria bacterium]|nr:DUF1801 domain-containing protein [Gammaproteobacteria bacterium]
MAEQKTKANRASVSQFLNSVEDETRRRDSKKLLKIMRETTGEKPRMWGTAIVGFGQYHYKYASGREGDWCITGFSPRKQALSVYIMSGFSDYAGLLNKLGKHKTGKSCLYIKTLEDVDLSVLQQLIKKSCSYMRKKYKT